jgi:MFS superfamily sulfate permease-like transporter
MSYNTAHIDVWDKEGYLHQIYQVQGQLSFANAERCKDSARKIVREAFPEYKRAVLIIMHYNKEHYNDKNKEIEL